MSTSTEYYYGVLRSTPYACKKTADCGHILEEDSPNNMTIGPKRQSAASNNNCLGYGVPVLWCEELLCTSTRRGSVTPEHEVVVHMHTT